MGLLNSTCWMVTDTFGSSTDWVGLDSSKRPAPAQTVIVIHSKSGFAQRYLDVEDLQPAASVLLRASARKFECGWIAQPNWFQIQRWRYANVRMPYIGKALPVSDTVVCGGDWCVKGKGASGIEAAYLSGLAMAEASLVLFSELDGKSR